MLMREYFLWNNCPNDCAFCVLKYKTRFTEEQMLTAIKMTKEDILSQTEQFNISIKGGEIFAGITKKVSDAIFDLFNTIFFSKLVNHITTISNMIFKEDNLLFKVLDEAVKHNFIDKITITTSYDIFGRYKNDKSFAFFMNNLEQLRNRYKDLEIIVNTILTRQLCQAVLNGEFDRKKFCNTYEVLSIMLPYMDFNGMEFFKPTQEELTKTLLIFKEQSPDWFKHYVGLMQDTFENIETKKSFIVENKNILSPISYTLSDCGHIADYKTCCKENVCFACLLKSLL